MSPNETLFLETTNKITKNGTANSLSYWNTYWWYIFAVSDISNSSFVQFQIWDFPGQLDFFDPAFDSGIIMIIYILPHCAFNNILPITQMLYLGDVGHLFLWLMLRMSMMKRSAGFIRRSLKLIKYRTPLLDDRKMDWLLRLPPPLLTFCRSIQKSTSRYSSTRSMAFQMIIK